MAQNNQKGKGKKKGGPKLRPPKTLEPLLKDPNYLVNLCNQRGRKQGTTALDEQIPRILKDICDPFVKVDMNVYGMYLITEPVYTRIMQLLLHHWTIQHNYNIALSDYLNRVGRNVQLQQPQQPQVVQQQYYQPPQSAYPQYDMTDVYGLVNSVDITVETVPQQQSNPVLMDQYTDINVINGLLNQARANEEVYGGAYYALRQFHDYYMQTGIVNNTSLQIFMNQNSQNYRFISVPDPIGVEFVEKNRILEKSERRERRNGYNTNQNGN